MSNALKSTDTEYRQGFRRLLAGLLLALALTLAAFSMVWFGLAVGRVLLISITLLAAIQMVVHLENQPRLGCIRSRVTSSDGRRHAVDHDRSGLAHDVGDAHWIDAGSTPFFA